MSRVARWVTCSDEDRSQLERLSLSRTEQARLVERARIVLGCLEGERNDQIAARMHLQVATVALWRKRFLDGGIAALGDLPPGKPPTYDKVGKVSMGVPSGDRITTTTRISSISTSGFLP